MNSSVTAGGVSTSNHASVVGFRRALARETSCAAGAMFQPIGPELGVLATHHRVLGLDARRQLVVARLRGGGLWVHSPAIVTPELRAALAELGPVQHVVGPNRWHDECLKEFQAAYPEAAFHAAPSSLSDFAIFEKRHVQKYARI